MPAVSQAQQKLMGMAYALKKGDMEPKDASDEVKQLADEMTLDQLKDYAETKHEGLPAKKESEETPKKLANIKTFEEFVSECDDEETDEEESADDKKGEESVEEGNLLEPSIFYDFKELVDNIRVSNIDKATIDKIQRKLDELKEAVR